MKVQLNSFHLNGHTLGFHLDLKVRTTLYSKQYHMKVLLNSFHLNDHTLGLVVKTVICGITSQIRISSTDL